MSTKRAIAMPNNEQSNSTNDDSVEVSLNGAVVEVSMSFQTVDKFLYAQVTLFRGYLHQ